MLEDLPSELDRGPLDPVRIFEALERHGVEYLTIGGVAVNVHGHVRNTLSRIISYPEFRIIRDP
jgi:uncharacterized protein (DUF1330 family)